MTESNALQRIAYQGEKGAFSELAILSLCGEQVHAIPCPEFGDVTHMVRTGDADFGLLPIDNTIAGPVHASIDAIAESGLHVVLTSEIPISLCLVAMPGATLETLRTVESHPVALRQCGRFLAEHPHLVAREAYDTAGAARLVSVSGDVTRSAVASARAASVYGLVVLRQGIEDAKGNTTRFVVVAREPAQALLSALDHGHRTTNLK
jgi:prephenate dehydratase